MLTFSEFYYIRISEVDDNSAEQGMFSALKKWATNVTNKLKDYLIDLNSPMEPPVQKFPHQEIVDIIEHFKKNKNEKYDQSLLDNYNFWDDIATPKNKSELDEGIIANTFLKGVWMIIKWMLRSIARIISAAMRNLTKTLTPNGFYKNVLYFVLPLLTLSPAVGAEGMGLLAGISPFIGWAIYHTVIAPAMKHL